MGMTTFNYYFTWFIRYFVVLVVVHVACSFIISSALSYVPFYVPLVTFLLFDVLIIIQNFFIQIFFTRSKIGVVIALLFFVLQYVISFLVSSNTATQDVLTKASIIPHAAFVIAFQTMLYGNSIQYPITFKDVIGSYTIVTALVSFAINIGVYLVLLWYLDQVVPN